MKTIVSLFKLQMCQVSTLSTELESSPGWVQAHGGGEIKSLSADKNSEQEKLGCQPYQVDTTSV